MEQTREGKLSKDIREVLKRLEGILGFRVKVCERTGSKVKDILSNTNPWSGSHCGREECVTCNQDCEDKPPCNKRSLVYENICAKCNPKAKDKGPLLEENKNVPSIYVGETARSVQERALEHWSSYKARHVDSHILKHMELHHAPEDKPEFIMKVVGYHKTALSRQCGEAVRIHKRGIVLNSKSEYSRCKIQRLSLPQPEPAEYEGGSAEGGGEGDMNQDWTQNLLNKRIDKDKGDRMFVGRVSKTYGVKRDGEGTQHGESSRRKRLKYELGDDNWGQVGENSEGNSSFLFSGLEGVKRAFTPKSSGVKKLIGNVN